MFNCFKNIPVKIVYIWALFFVLFTIYIGGLSYLYPYGIDEYILIPNTLKDIAVNFYNGYLHETSRIGNIYALCVLYLGKWSFVILNPFVQITVILSLFFLIFLRLPDFKTLKDFPIVLLIALLCLTISIQPDNTLFWISGATNYSWSILPFLWIMAYIRFEYQNKGTVNFSKRTILLLFICAVLLGMSSENSGPLTMGWMICFIIWSFMAKFKLHKHFYFIVLGLIIGLVLLFTAPAMHNRLKETTSFLYFSQIPLSQKIFWHIGHIHLFIKAMLLLPVFNFLALLICVLDKDKPFALRNKNYFWALIFFVSSVILVCVLFAIPLIFARCFYTASIASIISFIFLLVYLDETYNFKTIRYDAILAFCAFTAFTPAIIYPYISIHKAEKIRFEEIKKAKTEGKKTVFLMPYRYPKGPNDNLTINFYDSLSELSIYGKNIGLNVTTDDKEPFAIRTMSNNPRAL